LHVGAISLHSRDEKNGLFSFGILIGRDHRRKGYAAEAVRILLRYGFWERRYQKCNSACAHTNEGSIALHNTLTREEFDAQERRASRLWTMAPP
jgi:RimJ/RimL family protein N-acetyltransferase